MAELTPSEQEEKWEAVGEQVFTGAVTAVFKSDVVKWATTVISDIIGALTAVALTLLAPLGIAFAKGIAKSEDLVAPALAPMAAAAVNDMFGSNLPATAFEGGIQNGQRKSGSDALAAALIKQLSGSATALEPSSAPAERYVGVMVNMALEGWYQKWFFEFITSFIPKLEVGDIENFGCLDDKMAQALGLGRLSRRVLGPIVNAAIVTPLEWSVNKTYRPNLHSPAQVASEWAAGDMTLDQAREELARQGWSDVRQDAFFRDARKRLSLDEMLQLRRFGAINDATILTVLKQQGYDEITAAQVLSAKTDSALETIERSSIGAIQRAYINRNISLSRMDQLIRAIVTDASEAAFYVTAATVEHDVNVKTLTPAEAKACVLAGILAVSDYRAALYADGYDDNAVLALELLLRSQMQDAADADTERKNALAARVADQAARDAAALARKAQVEADRALHRRGSLNDLERAVVRGLVPIARYIEVLRPEYDPDTVQVLVDLVEGDRVAYVAQQARAEEARKRAGVRNVDVGALEQAVLTHVLTLDEFRGRLDQLGFPPEDAGLLADILGARMADAAAAAAQRVAADAAAHVRSIDLGRFERLVTRGARTLDDYRALLASLGFDVGSQAGMVDLLAGEIADAAAARQARAEAAAHPPPKGVTLEQMRRAVILGVKTLADYEHFLIENKFTTDAQAVLYAELRADVADAEDARQRRAATEAAMSNRALPLATIARAARLGLILPGVYQARLVADGYTADDIAIELSLLTFEIADAVAAKQKRDAPPPVPDPKGLTLEQMSRAVKAGVRTLDEYQARAFALGYSQEAVSTIVQLLQQELTTIADAQAARDALAGEPTREVSVSQLEAAVKAGLIDVDTYSTQLRALGYGADVAALLAMLLEQKLSAAAEA